ncbi:MAG: FISUMP domain-containing protein [Bacteroidales bacterium]
MNILRPGLQMAFASLLILSSCRPGPVEVEADGSFTDERDGQEYRYVYVGSRAWMMENLNYQAASGAGSWCYQSDDRNCQEYGRLYTWDAAMSACPTGWRLPSDQDWKELETHLGMVRSEVDSIGWRESAHLGIQLKATWDWNSGGTGENVSRFTALPAGFRDENGTFRFIGDLTTFWSSTWTDEEHAWGRALIYHGSGVYRWAYLKSGAYSVRCVRYN